MPWNSGTDVETLFSPMFSEHDDTEMIWFRVPSASFVETSCSFNSGNILNHKDRTVGVSPLKNEGRLFSDGLDNVEILNTQFKSVFTKEDYLFIPKLFGPNCPTIDLPIINQIGVEKLLSGLNVSKVAGPVTKFPAAHLSSCLLNLPLFLPPYLGRVWIRVSCPLSGHERSFSHL